MLAPKLDYSSTTKPDGSMLNYYVKLINEQKGETGLSGTCESETEQNTGISKCRFHTLYFHPGTVCKLLLFFRYHFWLVT